MSKVCLGVQSHEVGFQKCLELLRDPLVNTPTISDAVIKLIDDRDHFTANKTLVNLLKPVVDAIGNLERANTTLAHIWKELLDAYKNIRDVDIYTQFKPFKQHCLDVLHAQTKVLHEEIYVVAFFLHPAYCRVAVSKKHLISDIGQMILQIAKYWKFAKAEALLLQDAISRYYSNLYPFNSKNVKNLLNYWLTLLGTPKFDSLKKLVIGLLEIVPHAAGVKGLFSMMSAAKTKARNRMLPTTLKMMSQLKLHLLQDSFLTPAKLESFKEGVFTDNENLVTTSREDAFIDTLFDFNLWESPPQQSSDTSVIVLDEETKAVGEPEWSPEDLWSDHTDEKQERRNELIELYEHRLAVDALSDQLLDPKFRLLPKKEVKKISANLKKASDELQKLEAKLSSELLSNDVNDDEQRLLLLLWNSKKELHVQAAQIHAKRQPLLDAKRIGT
ncbi:hypothetical protein PCANC_10057 [Puccinia coronata f. sp. avenae]|uniref:Uncharacterized protein n=1 Tax=Puccinia coronata f. sp. avenae TaxID=200324 RepID=A0A2N5V0D5_9BASI|nr:hypothetical protein PCANC_10057 [Puccinia coronata f. sp. avenae]